MKRLKRHPETRSAAFKTAIAITVALAAAAGLAAYIAFFTGVCDIKRVEVIGNGVLEDDYVIRLSGIDNYEKLLTLEVHRIRKNIESDPWIEEAEIARRLPGTVKISVTERKPVAVLNCGGAGFLVDGAGYVITGVRPEDHPDLTHVDGGDSGTPAIEERIEAGRIHECAVSLGRMSEALRERLGIANPHDGRGIVFVTRDGIEILYGRLPGEESKEELLEAMLVDIETSGREVVTVDVRVPEAPVVRMR